MMEGVIESLQKKLDDVALREEKPKQMMLNKESDFKLVQLETENKELRDELDKKINQTSAVVGMKKMI